MFAPPDVGVAAILTIAAWLTALFTPLWHPINPIVPNAHIAAVIIFLGAAYDDDPHKVRALAIEAAQTVNRVLGAPRAPVCHVVGFGDSSVDYILRFWIMDPTGGLTNVRGAVFLALWDTFKENGISIPFPQREVRMLGEEA